MGRPPKYIIREGEKYGSWTVLHPDGENARGVKLWLCRCGCGNELRIRPLDLGNGETSRCIECSRKLTAAKLRRHGDAGSRLYGCWLNMRARCADRDHKDYGGRGISVCEEWASSYQAFREWALTNGYADNLMIERLDSNGNYEPGNCTWADRKTQNNNRSIVRRLKDGRPGPLVAEENGIPARTFGNRMNRGWTAEEASSFPYGYRRDRPPGYVPKYPASARKGYRHK